MGVSIQEKFVTSNKTLFARALKKAHLSLATLARDSFSNPRFNSDFPKALFARATQGKNLFFPRFNSTAFALKKAATQQVRSDCCVVLRRGAFLAPLLMRIKRGEKD
jgi:hypothetical protein